MPSPFGVYVHVPFCASRCDYCAFATWTDRDTLMAEYAEACVAELRRARRDERLPPATSVFVGGGTPSRLPGELLGTILGAVVLAPDAEVTVECNPEDASAPLLRPLAPGGGDPRVVRRAVHGPPRPRRPGAAPRDDAGGRRRCPLAGEAGFASVNVDLIVGAAGETDEDWSPPSRRSSPSSPGRPHVSAYALTVEPGTPLARDPARHPDDDTVRPAATSWRTPCLRRRATGGTRSPTGPCPATSAGTTPCTGPRATTGASGARRTRTGAGAGGGTSGRPSAISKPCGPAGPPTAAEELLTPEQSAFEGLALALRTSVGVPASVGARRPRPRRSGRAPR